MILALRPTEDFAALRDSIASRILGAGLYPDREAIGALVQEHREAFIQHLLVQYGLGQYPHPSFVEYLRSIEDVSTIEFLIRHHRGILKQFEGDLDDPEVRV